MNILAIGSCTGDKDVGGCPELLQERDFDSPERLRAREAELSAWARPAAELYTGWQHRYMMRGVSSLRRAFGAAACEVRIISAGYGVVGESQTLVPYEATFQQKHPKWIRTRANHLGIPAAVRSAVAPYRLVVFLLGQKYLTSIDPPVRPPRQSRFLYFTSAPGRTLQAPQVTLVPAGIPETRFGAGTVALKGKMFELLARGLTATPSGWEALLADDTPKTAIMLIERGAACGDPAR